jgi:hypothetical protein
VVSIATAEQAAEAARQRSNRGTDRPTHEESHRSAASGSPSPFVPLTPRRYIGAERASSLERLR